MKKYVIWIFAVVLLFGITLQVNAEEVYYTTSSGVELTETEYRYLTTLFWDDYVENISESQQFNFLGEKLLSDEYINNYRTARLKGIRTKCREILNIIRE